MAPKQVTPATKVTPAAKTAAPSTKPTATSKTTPTTSTTPAVKPVPPAAASSTAKSATPTNKPANAPPPSPAALRPHLLRAQIDALAMAIEFNKAWIADLQATISTSKSGLPVAEEKKRYEVASRELDELMGIVKKVGADSVGVREVMRLLGRLGKVRGRLERLEGGVMGWEI